MKRLVIWSVAGSLLLQPAVVFAQNAAPLLPLRASIERNADTPLMDAIRRDVAGLRTTRSSEQANSPAQPAPASDRRSWIGRHPALFGALVGAAAGTIAAGTMENELFCSTGSDEDCLFYQNSRFAVGAGIGAGVGALVGWIASLGRD
jgi:hypothetical protein